MRAATKFRKATPRNDSTARWWPRKVWIKNGTQKIKKKKCGEMEKMEENTFVASRQGVNFLALT